MLPLMSDQPAPDLALDIDLELLTATEAAALMKLAPSSVYRMMQTGEIAVVRFKRAVRIRKIDLQRFIDSRVEQKDAES